MKKYVMALDEGTTSCRAILFDHDARIVSVARREFSQIYPQPGWVEHDPTEIWDAQLAVAREAMQKAGAKADDIAAIGITDQRETTVIWEKESGRPIANAIVWQCRRTADYIEKLKADGLSDYVHQMTGLIPDAYFFGFQDCLDSGPYGRGQRKGGQGCVVIWDDRHVAGLEPDGWSYPCYGSNQCVTDDAV